MKLNLDKRKLTSLSESRKILADFYKDKGNAKLQLRTKTCFFKCRYGEKGLKHFTDSLMNMYHEEVVEFFNNRRLKTEDLYKIFYCEYDGNAAENKVYEKHGLEFHMISVVHAQEHFGSFLTFAEIFKSQNGEFFVKCNDIHANYTEYDFSEVS